MGASVTCVSIMLIGVIGTVRIHIHRCTEVIISSRQHVMMVRYCDGYCIYTMYTRRIDDIYVCAVCDGEVESM